MSTVLPEYRDLLAIRPLVREAASLGARSASPAPTLRSPASTPCR